MFIREYPANKYLLIIFAAFFIAAFSFSCAAESVGAVQESNEAIEDDQTTLQEPDPNTLLAELISEQSRIEISSDQLNNGWSEATILYTDTGLYHAVEPAVDIVLSRQRDPRIQQNIFQANAMGVLAGVYNGDNFVLRKRIENNAANVNWDTTAYADIHGSESDAISRAEQVSVSYDFPFDVRRIPLDEVERHLSDSPSIVNFFFHGEGTMEYTEYSADRFIPEMEERTISLIYNSQYSSYEVKGKIYLINFRIENATQNTATISCSFYITITEIN